MNTTTTLLLVGGALVAVYVIAQKKAPAPVPAYSAPAAPPVGNQASGNRSIVDQGLAFVDTAVSIYGKGQERGWW